MTTETLSEKARARGLACVAVNRYSTYSTLKGAKGQGWQREEIGSRGAGQEAQEGGAG